MPLPPPASTISDTPKALATPVPQIHPVLPLRAWSLAADGRAVLVLDAKQRLFRLAPQSLAVEQVSGPLFPVAAGGPTHLVDAGAYVIVGNESLTRTLVLDRQDFREVAQWDRAGPLAADPGQHVFMASERGLWAYDVEDPARPPVVVTEAAPLGLGSVPVALAADPAGRQLYVTYHNVDASPPHQREAYHVYNLDAPAQTRMFERQLGELARPAFAVKAGRTVSVLNAKNGFLGSRLLIYEGLNSQAQTSPAPLDGVAVTDTGAKRIYLLRERGLWVLDGTNLALLGVLPFAGEPPRDLALSTDGTTLYLFGDGWLSAKPTSELETLGIRPLPGPFPPAWTYPELADFFRARLFRSPTWESDGTAFVLVGGYGEMYRTTDRGVTWQLLPALSYPEFRSVAQLSLSPDYSNDHTLTAHPAMMRSTDGGDSWQPFAPRIAFVSERDGNREIYTADQDGGNVCRLTTDPGTDENPAWSPAWTRLAFQSNRDGAWRIYTTRADCGQASPAGSSVPLGVPTPQATGDDLLPAWSPDGRLIAFVSTRDSNPELYVSPYRPGKANARPLAGQALRLTYDPAGDWRPAWEPDNLGLVFTSGRSGRNGIYRLSWPGWEIPAGYVPPLEPLVVGPEDNRDPAVDRDGMLAFLSDRDGIPRVYALDTYPDAQPHPVSQDRQAEGHPAWVDDADLTVLVTLVREGITGVYRASYAGGHEPVAVSEAFNEQPAWGPPLWRPDAKTSSEVLTKLR